jgi:hypothetical protein
MHASQLKLPSVTILLHCVKSLGRENRKSKKPWEKNPEKAPEIQNQWGIIQIQNASSHPSVYPSISTNKTSSPRKDFVRVRHLIRWKTDP